jgi:hypothetical protein
MAATVLPVPRSVEGKGAREREGAGGGAAPGTGGVAMGKKRGRPAGGRRRPRQLGPTCRWLREREGGKWRLWAGG